MPFPEKGISKKKVVFAPKLERNNILYWFLFIFTIYISFVKIFYHCLPYFTKFWHQSGKEGLGGGRNCIVSHYILFSRSMYINKHRLKHGIVSERNIFYILFFILIYNICRWNEIFCWHENYFLCLLKTSLDKAAILSLLSGLS